MKSNFNDCLNRVLRDEGGYTNDPSDNGGPTNFGITLTDYRLYINKKGTAIDVKNMSLADAKSIYKSKYWDAMGCDSLSGGVDYTCFDYAVNSGLGRPRKALQRFKSLSGTSLVDAINNERTAFLRALAANQKHDAKFLPGWLSRVNRVRLYSEQLASKKDNTTGPVVATGAGGLFVGLSQFWHQYENYIIIGGVLLAIVAGTVIHIIKNKGK